MLHNNKYRKNLKKDSAYDKKNHFRSLFGKFTDF